MAEAKALTFKTWFRLTVLLCAAAVLSLATFNLIIDPYDLLGIDVFNGAEWQKTRVRSGGGRRHKSVGLTSGPFEIVVMGTSRSEVGINPRGEGFGNKKVYNVSLQGTNLYELYRVFQFVMEESRPERIVMEVSFSNFTTRRTVGGDFSGSLFNARIPREILLLRYVLSISTLWDSLLTVWDNLRGVESAYTDWGFRKDFKKNINHAVAFRKTLRNYMSDPERYGGFRYGLDRLELLREMVDQARRSRVPLTLFIPPVHAYQLETMRVLGLFDLFEKWKRDLVRTVSDVDPSHAFVELYDFSGYNEFTTEPVPGADGDAEMKWYWEPSHFKKALGDMVIKSMLGPGAENSPLGRRLTKTNVEAHLAKIREQQRVYGAEHPQAIAEIEGLAEDTEPFRMK